jgi:hypothetical protein
VIRFLCKRQLWEGEIRGFRPVRHDFLNTPAKRVLPESLNQGFIQALQDVLSGLDKVVLSIEAVKGALLEGGMPATQEEIKRRFEAYLKEQTKGRELSKVRIVVE